MVSRRDTLKGLLVDSIARNSRRCSGDGGFSIDRENLGDD